MKVALLGATGNVGTRLVKELVSRGHQVTGISRHPEKLEKSANVKPVLADLKDDDSLVRAFAGNDAVIHSVRFLDSNAGKMVGVVKKAKVPRLLVVGGAGSLEVAPGVALIDTPAFPAPYKPEASAGRDFLKALRTEKELAWTFLSPSAILAPGKRTGKFRLGNDQLLTDAQGQSHISIEDYVIALVDELEQPRHTRERFTVGY